MNEDREPGAMAACWSEMSMRSRITETLQTEPMRLGELRKLCWGDDDEESGNDFLAALSSLRGEGVVGSRGRYLGNAKRPYAWEFFLIQPENDQ